MAPKKSKAALSVHRPPPSKDAEDIRDVYRNAYLLATIGRITEALTLAGELVERHSTSPLARRAHATIAFFASCKTQSSDDTASRSYLATSLASARLAVAFSPSSIELPLWYVKNFFPDLANKEQCCHEFIKTCKAAFAVEDPVDPMAEALEEREARETPQLRVESVFFGLWYSIRCAAATAQGKDPPELNGHQIHGEVKRAVKWKEHVLRYLTTTHLKGFLSVSTSDLCTHLSSLRFKTKEDRALLGKALEANSTFNFWICPSCHKANTTMEFTDRESHEDHIVEQHVDSFSPDFMAYLPIEAHKEWIEFITGDIWEPFDLTDNTNGLHKSTDKQRFMLLGEVQEMLKMLVKNKNLVESIVGYVVQVCRRPLDRSDPDTSCICFLDVPNLERLLTEFHEFSKSCKSCKYDDQDSFASISDQLHHHNALLEGLIFYPLTSELLLDDHRFGGEFDSENPGTSAPPGDGDALHAKPNPSFLVSWLCDYKSIQDHLCTWRQDKEAKLCVSGDILEKLKLESSELNLLLEKKLRFLNQTKVFTNIINLLEEEEKKRKYGEEYVHQSYEAVLKQRQEELKSDLTPASEVIELELISEVLEKEKAIETSESAHPDGDSSSMHEHEADTRILVQTKKEMDRLCRELMMIDGRIMSTQMDIKHLKLKIGIASCIDYRNILLPLVKSFMKQQLGDLADKDAEEKSNAFFKELDDDTRRSKGDCPPKQGKQKSKGKRRNQRPRKASDKKAMVSSEEMLIKEIAGESEFLAENVGKNSESPSGGAFFETETECLDFRTLIRPTII